MPEPFDPYYKWLGIPADEQPANHYRLLGITAFEADAEVITRAADRLIGYVRDLQASKHGDLAVQIRNEIAQARLCLLDSEQKAAYDEKLREKDAPPRPTPRPRRPPKARKRRTRPHNEPLRAAEVPQEVATAPFDGKPDAYREVPTTPRATLPTTAEPVACPIDAGRKRMVELAHNMSMGDPDTLLGWLLFVPIRGGDRLMRRILGEENAIAISFFRMLGLVGIIVVFIVVIAWLFDVL
jgi:hypothetical protein